MFFGAWRLPQRRRLLRTLRWASRPNEVRSGGPPKNIWGFPQWNVPKSKWWSLYQGSTYGCRLSYCSEDVALPRVSGLSGVSDSDLCVIPKKLHSATGRTAWSRSFVTTSCFRNRKPPSSVRADDLNLRVVLNAPERGQGSCPRKAF